jgi:hypothetical protein
MLSFTVFSEEGDRYKWDKLIEFVLLHPEFSDKEKDDIKGALKYLSNTLGKKFLITSRSYNHFLAQHFLNLAPWALKWAIWFSSALSDLIKNDKDGAILNALKSKTGQEEGLTFLEINHYLTRAGFSIRFEQEIRIGGVSKFPDLQIQYTPNEENIYLELSSLHMHEEHDWNSSMFHRLSNHFTDGMLARELNFCGKIRNIEKDNFEIIKRQIELFKKSILIDSELYTIENEFLEIAVAGKACVELSPWASSRELAINSLSGDSITFDGEISRIKKKINTKARQLSSQNFNIIGVSVHQLFMMGGDKIRMLVEIVSFLEKFPHIFGVLVFGSNPMAVVSKRNGELDDWHLEVNGHLIASRTIADLKTTEFYFARNATSISMSPTACEMFYSAFRFGRKLSNSASENDTNQ